MNEQPVQRGDSDATPWLSPASSPPTAETADNRRSALAMAAACGAADETLVLGSDPESLALLGVDDESPLLADVLRWQGSVLRDRGKTAEAEELYKRSLHIAQRLDYLAGQSHAVNCLGGLAQRRGELQRANQLFQSAQRMAEMCGDHQLAGMIQQNRGVIADISGNTDTALSHYMDSLRSFEASNDTRSMTLVLNNLGLLHYRTEKYDDARRCYDRALGLARLRGDLLSEGVIEENVAELEMTRGDLSAANESIARSLEIAALRRDPLRRASGLKLLGVCLRLGGCAEDALAPLRSALEISEEGEDALLTGEIMWECGVAQADIGDERGARDSWVAALGVFSRIGATAWKQRVRERLADY